MEIITYATETLEYASQCCGASPFWESLETETKSGRCGKCLENTMFEIVCPECQGSNLSEDETVCWDCKAGDYA